MKTTLYHINQYDRKVSIIEGEVVQRLASFKSFKPQPHFYDGRTILMRDLGAEYNTSKEALVEAYVKKQRGIMERALKTIDMAMEKALAATLLLSNSQDVVE